MKSSKLKKSSAIVFMCLMSMILHAQITPDKLFAKKDLLSDLDTLHTTILKSHPNPFAFCDEEKFAKAYSDCRDSLTEETSLRDFTRFVTIFLNAMRDSHTSLDYGQLQSLQLKNEGYYLPINVRRIDKDDASKGFDLCIAGDWVKELPKGSALKSINGRSIESLYHEALDFACVEGNSEKAQSTVAAALLPLVGGFNHPYGAINTIEYVSPEGELKEVKVAGYTKSGIDRLKKEHYDKTSGLPTLEIDSTGVYAILKVSTFSPAKSGKYARRIRRSISEIQKKNIDHLIIDIRGNGGGSSAWVEFLYSFLDSSGYNTPSNVIGKSSQLALERNKLFHSGFVQFFVKLLYSHDEDVQSYQRISELPFGSQDTIYFHKPTIQSSEDVYAGKCYLLINGLTASAGVDFTNAFRTHQRGIIVGEECLGPATGTWGNPAFFVLPHTELRVTIATIRYNYDNTFRYETEAIQPDYEIPFDRHDLANEKDTQVAFIKKLITEKEK